MLYRSLFLAFVAYVGCLNAISTASAANIKLSYTLVYDRLRPEPQRNVRVTNSFNVALAQSGAVQEQVSRSAGRYSDGFKVGAKLGDGQWDVVGKNELRRTFDQPQSTLVLTVTTRDKACSVDVKFALKSGFTEYKFRRITDGTMAFFTEPKIESTRCSIQD